jgi:hypothetical protein
MKCSTIAALVLVTLSSPVVAQTTVRGPGTASCGAWVHDRTSQNDRDLTSRFDRESWIMGYITAYNTFADAGGDVARGTDARGLFQWIDNFCAGHPLDTVADATFALVSELRRRQR